MTLGTAAGSATKATAKSADAMPLPPLPPHWTSLQRAFVTVARSQPGRPAMADSTKVNLSFGETLLRACVLARFLSSRLGPAKYVGLLLPPTVPSAVANVALALLGKMPVNLNYTASQTLVDSSVDQCGITDVLTSQKVLDRFGIRPKGKLLFLEEIPKQVSKAEKAWGAFVAKFVPTPVLGMFLPGLKGDNLDQTATVIFTSGSTDDPKGVVLSNRNVLSNIWQMDRHLHILPDEVVLGILPFFHSFGFTVTIWVTLTLGKMVVYHFSPLDARIIGDLCEKYGVTLIAATPTFMRTYLKKCDPKQFSKLVHLLLGAEKVKPEFSAEVREILGIDTMEGYGCTELSPVVAVNVRGEVSLPDGRSIDGTRIGTVGRPMPGTEVKTIDPDSGADLPRGATGVVLARGPQVMVGYLNRPEATAKVISDGWYNTGDLGYVDDDGFLRITDRLSRFSKIGGEMVPHGGIETGIQAAVGKTEPCVAVTSLPDPKRGERLYVIYTDEMGMTPAEVVQKLQAGGMPRLWVPSADDFIRVDALPVLGQGKIDLKQLKVIAAAGRPA